MKEPARIVEVADDLVKAREVFRKLRLEFRTWDKERGHRTVFDATGRVSVEATFRERDDVLVAEDFDVRTGEAFAHEPDRREREDEVADGAATDDQDTRFHGKSGRCAKLDLRPRGHKRKRRVEPLTSPEAAPMLRARFRE